MNNTQFKTVEEYVVDTTTQVINGYDKLELISGNKYEVCYGIHQGVHEYVGKVVKNNLYPDDELFTGEHLFKNCKTGKLSFGYHGKYSPFEFTRIVKSIN
jgi:hypothetical protein